MDSEYALGRMVKKGAPVKPGFVFPYWQSPQPVSLMVMPWQDKPPANRSGIADGKHGVLGAPMHMQCKETHKCSQNRISWVWVKFSKSLAESPETVTCPGVPTRVKQFRPPRSLWSILTSIMWNIDESPDLETFIDNPFYCNFVKNGLHHQISESPPNILGN